MRRYARAGGRVSRGELNPKQLMLSSVRLEGSEVRGPPQAPWMVSDRRKRGRAWRSGSVGESVTFKEVSDGGRYSIVCNSPMKVVIGGRTDFVSEKLGGPSIVVLNCNCSSEGGSLLIG